MKWKNAALGKDVSLPSVSGLSTSSNPQLPGITPTSIIIAVAIALIGYIFGKMI